MRVHYLQHVPFEGLGCIGSWASAAGHTVSVTRLYQNDPLPPMDSVGLLVIMGGPMSIHETGRYPWLDQEKRYIGQAIEHGLPVLGICLGAQLIADTLGARVYAHIHKEIGWFPIYKTRQAVQSKVGRILPDAVDVFHWHGDTFDLPPGSVHLAYSEACRQQGFVIEDRIVGLQFHLEIEAAGMTQLIDHCRHELLAAPFVQTPDQMLARKNGLDRVNKMMYRLLDDLSDS